MSELDLDEIQKDNDSINEIESDDFKPEPVDSIAEVEVAVGSLSARVRVHEPRYDGLGMTSKLINDALKEAGVVYGINQEKIKEIVETNRYEEWLQVAECKQAENGNDGTIKYLFDLNEETKFSEDAKGYVDFKNLGIITNITRGTPIAEITLPTEGQPGINVKNESITQVKGKPAKVSFADNIVYSEDNLKLLAQCDGNLRIKSGRYCIETVVRLDSNIDLNTGNIDFIGEIIIRGDIKEGFSVKAKKNITVQGGVFGAVVESGENIVIRQGAVGSTLTADGKIETDFCEKCKIQCKELLKTKTLYFCDTFCAGKIDVTLSSGSIIGGKTVCTENLSANNIGTDSYIATNVVLGDNAIMLTEKDDLEKKLGNLEIELDNCNKIIQFLQMKAKQLGGLPKDKLDILKSATNTIIVKRKDITVVKNRIEEIDNYLKTKQNRVLICKKQMFPGVRVTINDQIMNVSTAYNHCQLNLGKSGIDIGTL